MSEDLINFAINNLTPQPNKENVQINKLFGQASSRQYFRMTVKDYQTIRLSDEEKSESQKVRQSESHQSEKSFVIMQLPQGFSSPAEEITKINDRAPKEFPFINIQKYLYNLDIKVPQVYAEDANLGLILLEDLGDQSLEKIIEQTEGEFFLFYYKKVIDTLIDLQTKTLEHPSDDCVAYYRRFDEDLLNWEFMHFLEYGIEDRKKTITTKNDKEQYQKITQLITKQIIEMPQGFVLRDYQSRNIFFKNYEFYLIDFQDALVGPLLYDLVALLRDSYININHQQCKTLLEYYIDNLPATHPYAEHEEKAKTDFYLITLHRKLKDTGRFQYINTIRKNPNFLVHVPQSLEYVKHAFEELMSQNRPSSLALRPSHLENLYNLVSKYLEELQ